MYQEPDSDAGQQVNRGGHFVHTHQLILSYLFRLKLYSLGNPSDFSDEETFKEGCDLQFAAAVMALNMNMNFLIGNELLICLIGKILNILIRNFGLSCCHPHSHHRHGSLQKKKTGVW